MAGIYIHIPFCKQRCHYCDFYSSTQIELKPKIITAFVKELNLRKGELKNDTVNTIYFGGGTPSLLSGSDINLIIEAINNNYCVGKNPEITLEANPDDLTIEKITKLKQTPVNRLSLGIQSFFDDDLKLMNRRHSAEQAKQSVYNAQNNGFNNISVDLIYGLPNLTANKWQETLNQVSDLKIQHLSAYHLTYEKGTIFDIKRQQGKLNLPNENQSITQFEILLNWANINNFEHYEISNFAKLGFISQHNSAYWKQKKYLGIGPSAHSYNIDERWWNPSENTKYINAIMQNNISVEKEILSKENKFNELIITSLRTNEGINISNVEIQFGNKLTANLINKAQAFIKNKNLYVKNNHLILTNKGIFISDTIIETLMTEI